MMPTHLTPIHPGKVLQDELQEIEVSIDTLAKHIEISPTMIHEVCDGKRNMTALLAMKLSRALGASPQFWLNLQNNWELSQVQDSDYAHINSIGA